MTGSGEYDHASTSHRRRPEWRPRNSTSRSSPTTSPTCAPPATTSSAPSSVDLLYEHVSRVGSQTSDQGNMLPAGIELGSGVNTAGTPRIMSARRLGGPPASDYDIAIRGEGFFKIQLPGRPHRLYPRRFVRARRARAAWSPPANPGAAEHHHSAERAQFGEHQQHRARSRSRVPGTTAPTQARPARTGDASSTKPACRAGGDNL